MRKGFACICLLSSLIGLHGYSQQADIVKFNTFENLCAKHNDTTYVINFWATWCVPCVKELPYFDAFYKKYKNEKLRVILLSLDFVKDHHTKLLPFIQQRKIESTVYLLDEPDYNAWIDKVDKNWGGNIPATIIFNNKKNFHLFRADEFTYQELEDIVKPQICN